jgi:hypothetical protein
MVLPREVQRQLAVARGEGLVASERIFAAAFVAEQALYALGRVGELEVRMTERAQFGDGRYRDVVDTFTGVVRAEIASLGMRWAR